MRSFYEKLTHPDANVLAFGMTGVVGLFVDVTCYALAQLWLPVALARVVSIVLAITATWLLNRRYSFRPSTQKTLLREYLHYFLASLFGAAVNYLTFLALIALLAHSNGVEYLAIFISSAVAAAVNFLLYKHKVFSKPSGG